MGALGAHEVVVETPHHDKRMSQFSDEEIERVLSAWATRIADLKKDPRFKYVTVFKNQGSARRRRMVARTFANHRDDIRSAPHQVRAEFRQRMVSRARAMHFLRRRAPGRKNGKRIVDVQGDYYALCPYASRVPIRNVAAAPQAQSSFRAAAARLKSPSIGRVARPRLAPPRKSRAGVSHGGSHGAQHAQQKRRTRRLLENARRRFSLAHRNSSDPRKAQQVVQHQRGLLQRDAAGNRRRGNCAQWIRIREVVGCGAADLSNPNPAESSPR